MHRVIDKTGADMNAEKIKSLTEINQKSISAHSVKEDLRDHYLNNSSSSGKPPIIIEEVLNRKQLGEFLDLPYRLYAGNKYFVPQLKRDAAATLDPEKNPAFDFCEARYWLAYKEGRVAGRIAGIINHAFNKKWNQSLMKFGWIDFEEDERIAFALLRQVENWAGEKKLQGVHGPFGFTNFDYAGMLTEGFQETGTFATVYNYPYYPEFLEKAGYQKEKDWVEFKIQVPGTIPEKLVKAATVVEKRLQLSVVKIRKVGDILPYTDRIFQLINSAYGDLFGMVPLTEKQIRYYTRKYFSFIKPDFISLVVDPADELAAFGITMPSLSHALQKAGGKLYPFGFLHLLKAFRKNKIGDMCLVAVRKDLQGKGVNAILMREINASYIKHKIEYAESNPELEENLKVQSIWSQYQAIMHKRRRSYIKYL